MGASRRQPCRECFQLPGIWASAESGKLKPVKCLGQWNQVIWIGLLCFYQTLHVGLQWTGIKLDTVFRWRQNFLKWKEPIHSDGSEALQESQGSGRLNLESAPMPSGKKRTSENLCCVGLLSWDFAKVKKISTEVSSLRACFKEKKVWD